uniref:Structural maintenance of chromosomes protein 5 n=1 Tax=Glossina palpalis gambiensis TaxID=67801 RepID=A0A1B0B4R9_9MUSC
MCRLCVRYELLKRAALTGKTPDALKALKEQDFKQAETNKVKILEKIEHIKATINNKKIDFRKRKCEQAEREKDLQNAVQLLEVYVQDLENLKAECSSDSELTNAYNQSMECQKVELKRLNQNHTRLNQRLEEFRPEIGSLKKQIESLENVGDQKLLFLQQNFPDVCEAMKWIEENENLFEARVYKPIMLEINVRNPDHTKYLENIIMFRDFQAFSCESKNDMSLLITNVRYNVSISKYSGEKIFSQVQIECRNILPSIDVQQIEQKKHRFTIILSELGRAIDNLRNQRSLLEAEMREKEVLYKEKKDKLRFLNDYAARLDCMEDVNSEILREHENKVQEIKAIESEIQGVLEDNQDYVAKIRTIYDSWFPTVDQVIGTINKHFSDFMRSMGYVGEVRLTRKDTYDFGSFGIEILVQYRQNVPLQALNRHVQSGGERAVAIAAFTLSMQHISHVPFRCVDEINQGMDARNERKIFDMLVDETTKTGSSQYFFVTPKLLRNLKSHKRASVHLVFNGCKIESKDAFIFVMPS